MAARQIARELLDLVRDISETDRAHELEVGGESHWSPLPPENAKALCTPAQDAAGACPAASIVGRASARTRALHEPIGGPIYFVEGTRTTASGKVVKTLPKLLLKLSGDGVSLVAVAVGRQHRRPVGLPREGELAQAGHEGGVSEAQHEGEDEHGAQGDTGGAEGRA